MGGGLRGDFVRLRAAIVKIKSLASTVPQVARVAAVELRAQVTQEFATGSSPYGTRWKPLAPATIKRWGPHAVLVLTGAMSGGVTSEASGDTIKLSAPSPAFLHQRGWRRALRKPKKSKRKGVHVATITHGTGGPARPIFPDGRVPNSWRQAIRRIARRYVTGRPD